MTGAVPALRQYRPTYMDGEAAACRDVVMVDPLDRARYADVVQVDPTAARVFLRYHDFDEPAFHWCSTDRCELVHRAVPRRRR